MITSIAKRAIGHNIFTTITSVNKMSQFAKNSLKRLAKSYGHNLASSGLGSILNNKTLEATLKGDPSFKRAAERMLGGKILFGKTDGNMSIRKRRTTVRFNPGHHFPGFRPLHNKIMNILQRIADAKCGGSHNASSANNSGDSSYGSILNDPNMSLEAKIMAFMSKQMKEAEDKINETMKQAEGKKSGGGGGFFKKIGGFFKKAVSTALPIAGSFFGPIGTMAGGALGSLLGGSGSQNSNSSSQTDKETARIKLQQYMDEFKRITESLSHMLKSLDKAKSAVANNLRA